MNPPPAIIIACGRCPWDVADAWIVGPDVTGVHPGVYLAEVVASDELGRGADEDTREANMRLIALAPEMFDFIETVASGNSTYLKGR
jgi:hypothetical protein